MRQSDAEFEKRYIGAHFQFVLFCRPFTIPQILRKKERVENDEDEDEEETIPVLISY